MKSARGFSAVLVLGIMVLLGGMLAFAVTLTSGMSSSAAQEFAQARAQQAANAGLEWARFRIRIGALPNCAALTNMTMPFAVGVPVSVRCVQSGSYIEGAATVLTYQLSATACSPAAAGTCPNPAGGSDYVQSQVGGIAER
jgi:MSHA biogenesis protein MshP